MFLAHSVSDVQQYLNHLMQNSGCSQNEVGFVPTMGFLHEGHLELVRKSKQKCKISVVSIFVNPAQFNNVEDLEKYPNDIPKDLTLLQTVDVDLVFIPQVEEIYPKNYTTKQFHLQGLDTILEGEFRPGHFQGVCAVIARFIEILQPGYLFLGQKDIQQCAVIGMLIRQLEGVQPKLSIVPTVRGDGGLALSSRNARISSEKIQGATKLYEALKRIQERLSNGEDFENVKSDMIQNLNMECFDVEYLELVSISDMKQKLRNISRGDSTLVTAAWYEGVRLIDNIIL